MAPGRLSLEELRAEVAAGGIDTVRVCFSDHYGMLRGRRLVGEVYAEEPEAEQAFCDGALVWDVHCDIFEEADYSNFRTGYPDLFAVPDLDSLRLCGWSERTAMVLARVNGPHGDPAPLDPRGLLARAAASLEAQPVRVTLSVRAGHGKLEPGWKPAPAPGFAERWREGLESSGIGVEALDYDPEGCRAVLALPAAAPVEAADALVQARSAAREIGLVQGITVTTLGRLAAGEPDEAISIVPAGGFPASPEGIGRLSDLAVLCRPLPAGWPAGDLLEGEAVMASAAASPYLAIAATLLGAGAAAPAAGAGIPGSLGDAARRLAAAKWAGDWLPEIFVHDTVEIALREDSMREQATAASPGVTAWDIERYAEVG